MASIQNTYAREHQAAYEGQISDAQPHRIVSAIAEEPIPFGRVVVRGTNEDEVALPAGGATPVDFIGISVRRHIDVAGANDVLQYETGRTVEVLDEGTITMIAQDAVSQDATAFVRISGGNEGQVRSDADGGAAVAVSGVSGVAAAYFLESAAAGEAVRVRFSRLTV